MRRILSLVGLSTLLVLSGCTDDLTTTPESSPTAGKPALVTSDACGLPASQIRANLSLLMEYVTPNDNSALSKFARVEDAVAAGDYELAQAELADLLRFLDLKYNQLSANEKNEQIDTNGDGSKDTKVSEYYLIVVAQLECFAQPQFDLNPGDPAKVFTSDADSAGVYFPAGYVPVGFNVAITTPAAEALVTNLDKYPSYIDIRLLDANGNPPGPGTEFNTANGLPVVVVCFPSGLANEIYDRLLLGHQTSGGFELLAKVNVPAELAAAVTCGTNLATQTSAFGKLLRKIGEFLLPEKLQAAYFAFGGVGGSPEEFSPFGAVDPGLLGGGAGGSPEEFSPGVIPTASTGGPMTSTVSDGGTRVTGTADEPDVTDPNQLPKVRVTTTAGTPIAGVIVSFSLSAPDAAGSDPITGPTSAATLCGLSTRDTTDATGYASVPCINFGADTGYKNLRATFDPSGVDPLACIINAQGACATATTSVNFLVQTVAGAATKLVTVSAPTTAQAGIQFSASVRLRDAYDNNVTQAGIQVTASLVGGGTLVGDNPVATDANGVATFLLNIEGGIGPRSLTFSSGPLVTATSGSIDLQAGNATRLKMVTEPAASWKAGVAPAGQPSVQVVDNWDNPVAANATVSASLATGADTLAGTLDVATNASGLAAFTDLRIDGTTAGTRTLTFESAPLTAATSTTVISVTPGNPAALVIAQEPSATATAGTAFAQQPVVEIRDGWNNLVTDQSVTVTASITSGGLGTLAGTLSKAAVGGVAAFSGLRIDGLVGSRTLDFNGGSLPTVTSTAIEVGPGAATTVRTLMPNLNSTPAASYNYGSLAAGLVAIAPRVLVTDAFGNGVGGETVAWSPTGGANGSLLDPTGGATTGTDGVAQAASWTIADGLNQVTATITGSTAPANFTATGPTGMVLFACALGGSKADIGYLSIPTQSSTVRTLTLYMSVTGQSSTVETYPAVIRVLKGGATGDSIGGGNGGVTLPGNNGTATPVSFTLSDPVFTSEAGAAQTLWIGIRFPGLPTTRKMQVWYQNVKNPTGDCANALVYAPGTTTRPKKGLSISVTN